MLSIVITGLSKKNKKSHSDERCEEETWIRGSLNGRFIFFALIEMTNRCHREGV